MKRVCYWLHRDGFSWNVHSEVGGLTLNQYGKGGCDSILLHYEISTGREIMTRKPFFKFLCTLTLLFYSCAVIQAGQVITKTERDWAKKALAQETQLGTIDSSQSLAVLYFHNKTPQKKLDALQKGLALMLITDLSKLDNFFVVERVRMQALFDEMDIGESGLVDEATAPRVGKLLKAYYVIGGDIEKGSMQEQLALDSRVIDVPFENTSLLPPTLGSVDELIRMEKDLLFNIIGQLKIPVTPAQKKELEAPLSLSLAALLALFAGIEYSDKGNYDKAAEMYNRAMAEDSSLELAETSLQELTDMGLVTSQDLTAVDTTAEAAAAEGGMSWGTIGAITLGLAAVGGGIALIASSSDDDDDDGGGGDTTNTGDGPTVTPRQTTGTCSGDAILFDFSDPMVMSGTVSTDWENNGNGYVSADWETSQLYFVSWTGNSNCISTTKPTMTISFSPKSFVTIDGVSLTGQTSFTITME